MKLRNVVIGLSAFGIVHLLLWWQPVFSGVVKGGTGTITSALGANSVTKRSMDQGKRSARELFDAFTRLGFSPVDLARRQAVMRELCAVDAAAACDAFETLPKALREGVCRDFCKMISEVNPGAADVILRRLSGMPKSEQYHLIAPLSMWHPEIIEGIGDELYQYQHPWAHSKLFDSRVPLDSLVGLVGRPDRRDSGWSAMQLLRRSGEWSAGELEAARDKSSDADIRRTLELALAIQGGENIPVTIKLPEGDFRWATIMELFASPQFDSWANFEEHRLKGDIDDPALRTSIFLGIADPRWQEFGMGMLEKTVFEDTEITPQPAHTLVSTIVATGIYQGGLSEEELAETIMALPDEDVKNHGIEALVSNWVNIDSTGASTFVAEHPEIEGISLDKFYDRLAQNVLDSPVEAAALALMLPDTIEPGRQRPRRETLISQVIYSAEIQGINPMDALRNAEAETGRSFLESELEQFSKEVSR